MVAMLAPVEVEQRFLSLPEAAEELGISHVQIWRLVGANKLPVVQIGLKGRRWLGVRPEALEAYRAERREAGLSWQPASIEGGRPRKPAG